MVSNTVENLKLAEAAIEALTLENEELKGEVEKKQEKLDGTKKIFAEMEQVMESLGTATDAACMKVRAQAKGLALLHENLTAFRGDINKHLRNIAQETADDEDRIAHAEEIARLSDWEKTLSLLLTATGALKAEAENVDQG